MQVVLCVSALNRQLSGIGRYTWELCNGLARSEEVSRLQFYRDHLMVDDLEKLRRAGRARRFRRYLPQSRARVKDALHSSVVHGPNYFLPAEAMEGVITVHDLSVFRFPEMHPLPRLRRFDRLFTLSLARASQVITDTDTVRREVIEMFAISPDRVSVVPLGVDLAFRPFAPEQIGPLIANWGLVPGRYGLSVAAFEPRKKIAELIAAWRRLPASLRNNYPLVLAGGLGWQNEALHEQINSAAAEGWLKHLGFVDEALLPALYAGARLFVYPSIYEGFGLPPIEAMASGAPVIVSDRSCLPEVCGAAARFIEPDDVAGFTSAIEECLCDEQWRSMTIRRGLANAAAYSWERCVSGTIKVYRKASA